jgi:hypothetical protein
MILALFSAGAAVAAAQECESCASAATVEQEL